MVKSLADLPADIHKLLDGAKLENSIGKFKDDIGNMMLSRFSEEDRDGSLRMSNIGRPVCQLWYEVNNHEGEKLSGKTKFKFLYGHILESLVLFLAEEAGHTVERLQEEIEVSGIKGHIDAVIDGVLVDLKSCSSYSFDKFQSGRVFTDDPFGYVGQLSGYAQALGLPAAWIPIDKVSGDICVTYLPEEEIRKYDIRSRIEEVRKVTSVINVPERCFSDKPDGKSGNRKLDTTCSYCAHKFSCWKDSNGGRGLQTYYYASGPRYLTQVSREPKVTEGQEFTSPFTIKDAPASLEQEEVNSL